MTSFNVVKDPDAVLDYQIDWSGWLSGSDQIATSVWSVTGPDSALVVDNESETTTASTVWLSGGTANEEYTVTNRITTNDGRTDDRSITIAVQER